MKTVRLATFETNSSSTHAICMCSEEDYQKFKNMELFWKYERLATAEELYEEFIKPFNGDRANWDEWVIDLFDNGLCGKLPSIDLFKKALTAEEEFHYVRCNERRDEYNTEEDWIIANIQSWFSTENIGNESNYSFNGDYYYETFSDSFNGVVAFGYYGHD